MNSELRASSSRAAASRAPSPAPNAGAAPVQYLVRAWFGPTGGTPMTLIWDGGRPLALGHPIAWVLELREGQLRLRDLSAAFDKVNTRALRAVKPSEIGTEQPFEAKGCDGRVLRIAIRPLERPRAAFDSFAQGKRAVDKNVVRIYECRGDFISHSETLGQAELEISRSTGPLFRLGVQGDSVVITSMGAALDWNREGSSTGRLDIGKSMSVPVSSMGELTLSRDGAAWRFNTTLSLDLPAVSVPSIEEQNELQSFKRSVQISGAGALIFLILAALWPEKELTPEEELIPAQYAQVLMQHQEAPSSAAQAEAIDATAERAEQTAVAQALRSEALQNSISGLLKGGMTSLLASSDLAKSASASKDLFGGTRKLTDGAPKVDTSKTSDIKVAALGKKGGYGTAGHAKVAGQGGGQISLDVEAAEVADGLSLDEVGKVIHAHMGEVRYCYDTALIRNPSLEGKLVVSFTIGGKGAIKSTSVQSSTLGDPRLDDCILRRLARWQFPTPRGGGAVAVTYPFIFKSLGL